MNAPLNVAQKLQAIPFESGRFRDAMCFSFGDTPTYEKVAR